MSDVTLLELNVPDGDIQLGPKSLRRGSTTAVDETTTEPTPTTSDEGGSKLRFLLVAGFVAFLVVAAIKVLSEDADEELAELDET